MALLTKAQILEKQDIRTETIAVPEWGGEVKRTWHDRHASASKIAQDTTRKVGKRQETSTDLSKRANSDTFITGVVEPVFDINDTNELLSAKSIRRIAAGGDGHLAAQRDLDEDEIEEMRKNSETNPAASSSSS